MSDVNCLGATGIGCLIVCAIPVVLFGGCVASVFLPSSGSTNTQTNTNVSAKIGDIANLHNGIESAPVTVFASEKIASDFLGAMGRKDKEGALNIWLQGGMFETPSRTRVRILGYGGFLSGLTHVRVLEGQHYAKDGWVPGEWIKKP